MMKKVLIIMLFILTFLIASCTGKTIEERSFTYYDLTYGKFYIEVDQLIIDELDDIITLTMKYIASQAHTFSLDTLDYGKAGMMSAKIRYLENYLYSSDDVATLSEGGEVTFEINEKVFRNVQFSVSPFDEPMIIHTYPQGDYVICLYVDGSLLIETDLFININL